MNKKTTLIVTACLACLLVIIIALLGVYFIKQGSNDAKYREYVDKGEKYLADLEYDDAIASFKFALKLNDEDEAAYIGLAEAYEGRMDYMLAKDTLEKGVKKVGSSRLRLLLEQLIEKYGLDEELDEDYVDDKVVDSVSEELAGSDKVQLDVSMMKKLVNYTNENYVDDFGTYSENEKTSDSITVTYSRLDAAVTYKNVTGEADSISKSSKRPVDEAKPVKIVLNDIGLLFRNFNGVVSNERLAMIVGSKLNCKTDDSGRYVITFKYQGCKFTIETDDEGNIISNNAWNEIVPPRPEAGDEGDETNAITGIDSEEVASTLTYQGVVVDAVTGSGLDGADVVFSCDAADEDISVVSGSDGSYEVELLVNESYDVEISKEGYITETFEIETNGEPGEIIVGDAMTISPELEQGEIRIVLTWGANPSDLDSHLEGTTANGENVSVSYSHKQATANGETLAELDVDDRSAYGPETTTIYAQGTYKFSVYDYSRAGSQAMTDSGAEVKVYLPGSSTPKVFTIPAGEGEWWHVFEIRNGEIITINERSDNEI